MNAGYSIGAKTSDMTRTNYYLLSSLAANLRSYFFTNIRSKRQNSGMICATVATLVLLVGMFTPSSADAKIDESTCKQMYERYKELGEDKFREKYRSKHFVNDCIKLYKNPNWYFVGKTKIDKNYEKIQLLTGQKNEDKNASVKILNIHSLGQDRYMIKFQACAKSSISKPSFILTSKIEQYVGISSKLLQAGKCNDYNTQIKAIKPSNIQVEYVSDPSKYPVKSKLI